MAKLVIQTEMDTKMIDKQIALLQDKLEGLVEEYDILEKTKPFEGQNKELLKLSGEIDTTKKKIAQLTAKKEQFAKTNFMPITSSIDNIGNSISKVIKKVTRWGLAVFGIRSAYMAVRNAINALTQDDEQLKADIDYVKNVFAYALEPVVRNIVELAKQLLIYIAQLIRLWTGKNIFENANKSLKKANGSANELKKTLAGFDEMNILGGSSAGGGGIVSPSFDLNQDSLFANWNMEKFVEKGKEIATKIGTGINNTFEKINWAKLAEGLSLAIIGLIEIISTLISTIDWSLIGQSIATFILNIDWLGIATSIMGLLFDGMLAGVDLIGGVIIGILDKFTDPKFYNDLYEDGKIIIEKLSDGMSDLDVSMEKVWQKIISFFLKKLGVKENDAEDVGNKLAEGIRIGMENLINSNEFFRTFNFIIKVAKKVFGINSPSKEFKEIGKYMIEGLINGLKDSANGVIDFINKLINKINGALSFRWNDITIGGVKLLDAGSLNFGRIPNIPRLAKGGIVNMPSKGVPVGSAIAGERGQEGVIPLTDSQQMALLGEAIGKYINVNATIPIYMGNRMVARELKRINAEDNFAYNR